MPPTLLIKLALTIISCCPNQAPSLYPLEQRDLLLFLNSNDWQLHQLCLNGKCKDILDAETYPFGIDTENVVPNFCNSETGDFYTLGKYHWQMDPETFENRVAVFSDPDYFKISEVGSNENDIKIKLCTPYGFYAGTLKIIDTTTIQIIANRPEYKKKEVIQVYKKQ